MNIDIVDNTCTCQDCQFSEKATTWCGRVYLNCKIYSYIMEQNYEVSPFASCRFGRPETEDNWTPSERSELEAVLAVRCQNCRYQREFTNGKSEQALSCELLEQAAGTETWEVHPKHFCSWGRPKI